MTPESLAVAVIVLAFALRAVHQLFPAVSRNAMTRLRAAIGLETVPTPTAGGDCNSGCGSCNNCGTGSSTAKERPAEAPIRFQPPSKR